MGWLCALVGIVCASACTAIEEHAELRVEIAADAESTVAVQDLLAVVEKEAPSGGWSQLVMRRFDVNEGTSWPLRFKIGGTRGSLHGIYQLTATARDRQGAVVSQARVIRSFQEGSAFELPVRLDASCVFHAEVCDSGMTCHAGQCIDARIEIATDGDPAQLSDSVQVAKPMSAAEAEPCSSAGAHSCAGPASRQPFTCDGARWRADPECAENQRCATSEGPDRGTCKPVLDECIGRAPDEGFCKDDEMLVCRDLVTVAPRACPENARCVMTDAGARCECRTGFHDDGGGCREARDCSGCDELTTCMIVSDQRMCGSCPPGYTGSGDKGCKPQLSGLTPASGSLNPPFDPAITDYALDLPLLSQRLSLDLVPAAGSRVEVNGTRVGDGAWRSGLLALGQTKFEIAVIAKSGTTTTYHLTATRHGIQDAYMKPAAPSSGDAFGLSIAFDGNTAVVGANYEDGSATVVNGAVDDAAAERGAAYVFVRNQAGWSQEAYLKAMDAADRDYFGTSVAISGDTIAVGATRVDILNPVAILNPSGGATAARSGSVYVFVRKDGSWTQQARLDPIDGEGGDNFGYHLSIEGDTLVVGATKQGGAGAAYVYTRSGGIWTQQQKLTGSGARSGSLFGCNVAISGDVIAVGAQNDDSGASDAGAAYVFARRPEGWIEQAQLLPNPARSDANFGYVLALYRDRLIVGAPRITSVLSLGAAPSGEVYVFEHVGQTWNQMQVLTASTPRASDYFGASVAMTPEAILIGASGDSSGNGGIGTDAANTSQPSSGAAYLFAYDAGTWKTTTYIKPPRPRSNEMFGFGVALSADSLIVSAVFDSSNGRGINGPATGDGFDNSGALYAFH